MQFTEIENPILDNDSLQETTATQTIETIYKQTLREAQSLLDENGYKIYEVVDHRYKTREEIDQEPGKVMYSKFDEAISHDLPREKQEERERLLELFNQVASNQDYRNKVSLLLSSINLADSEEAIQKAFIEVYFDIVTMNDRFDEWKWDEEDFQRWIYVLARSRKLDLGRSYIRYVSRNTDLNDTLLKTAENDFSEEVISALAAEETLKQILPHLNEMRRIILVLRLQGLVDKEIAKVMDISRGTVSSNLSRIYETVRKIHKSDKGY